jgi:hypothetical protein
MDDPLLTAPDSKKCVLLVFFQSRINTVITFSWVRNNPKLFCRCCSCFEKEWSRHRCKKEIHVNFDISILKWFPNSNLSKNVCAWFQNTCCNTLDVFILLKMKSCWFTRCLYYRKRQNSTSFQICLSPQLRILSNLRLGSNVVGSTNVRGHRTPRALFSFPRPAHSRDRLVRAPYTGRCYCGDHVFEGSKKKK